MGAAVSFLGKSVEQREAENNEAIEQALKESWQIVKKEVDVIGRNIFIKLFEEDPQTFQMFKSFRDRMDWQENKAFKAHSRTVINVIGSYVSKQQTEAQFNQTINTMGTAHSFFDIKPQHFDIMREEMLVQLQNILKEKFTPPVKKGWLEGYDAVAKGLVKGMKEKSSRRAVVSD